MSLASELESYIRKFGNAPEVLISDELTARLASVVMLGDHHLARHLSARVCASLMASPQYKFFATEYIQHEGAERVAFDRFFLDRKGRAKLPSGLQDFGRLLASLRDSGTPVLGFGSGAGSAGSAAGIANARDQPLADNLLAELGALGLSTAETGVVLAGAVHSSLKPYIAGQRQSMRAILSRSDVEAISVLIVSDAEGVRSRLDGVHPTTNPRARPIQLLDLVSADRKMIAVRTQKPSSPFKKVRPPFSDSGKSIAQGFEVVILVREAS